MIIGYGQAVGEFDFVGKHIGEFGGIAATGREVRVPYCIVYELEGNTIRALRGYMPMDVLLHQSKVFPLKSKASSLATRGCYELEQDSKARALGEIVWAL